MISGDLGWLRQAAADRPCFINPHTQLADVDALADHVITIGDELTGRQPG